MDNENNTKKCRECQTDIPLKAKRCPNCKSDQRNWFGRHKFLTGLGALIIFFIIIGVSSNTPKKIGENKSTNPSADVNKSFSIGEQIQLGKTIITVNKVEFSQGGQFTKPAEGNE